MWWWEGLLTACMRAPELVEPLVTATALPLMSALDFCLFTTICEDPKDFEAGRFAADMLAGSTGEVLVVIQYPKDVWGKFIDLRIYKCKIWLLLLNVRFDIPGQRPFVIGLIYRQALAASDINIGPQVPFWDHSTHSVPRELTIEVIQRGASRFLQAICSRFALVLATPQLA